jgi:23S rRNA pseudouridine1911/1915/1917 synthase
MPPGSRLEIIYEDNHILVAIKPAGVLSQADASGKPDMLNMLKADLKERYQKPGAVYLGLIHRLDQPVSGLMVFARTSKAAARLSEQVRLRQIGKYYLAVVQGIPKPERATLTDDLVKDNRQNRVRVAAAGQGQTAILTYEVLAADEARKVSLLQNELGTGRSHQIRVQLASRGWPLWGDRKYGTSDPAVSGAGSQNLALFACRLRFRHPTRDEILDFRAAPPDSEPWSWFPREVTSFLTAGHDFAG